MYVVVLLQVSQLSKTLPTGIAFERPFTGVCSQMHFQVGKLPKSLATHVALVVHLSVFLADWIRQRPVTARVAGASGTSARRHVIRRHRTCGRASGTGLGGRMVGGGVVTLVATVLRREQMRLMVVRHVLHLLAGGCRVVHEYGGRRAPLVHLVQGR